MNRENVLKWYINISKGAECEAQKQLLYRLKKILISLKEKPPT